MRAAVHAARVAGVFLLLITAGTAAADGGIGFEDAASAAGIDYVGPSWGSAWGNYDGDAHPDLWLVDHWNRPGLYANQGNGTFQNLVLSVIPEEYWWQDTHGAVWVDYDNDGDQDLHHLTDYDRYSYLPLQDFFFINDGGTMTETADSLGLIDPLARGRMPVWLDYDGDGLLDVYRPASSRGIPGDGPTTLFRHGPYGFVDVSDQAGFDSSGAVSDWALLADLSGDGVPELIPQASGLFPYRVYRTTETPFTDLRDSLGLPQIEWVNDAVAADLDGDLDIDFFLVCGEKEEGLVQTEDYALEAGFLAAHPVETGFRFTTSGDVTFDIYPRWKYPLESIHIGSSGRHPEEYTFTCSPADSTVHGVLPHTPGDGPALYIGYDSTAGRWAAVHAEMAINYVVESTEIIEQPEPVGWDPEEIPFDDHYLANEDGSFADRTTEAGFDAPSSGRNVLAGDFDNDMDLDLYIVSTGPVENAPNLLYRNEGEGAFASIPGAGGAAGNTDGRGDAATVVDYDGDGFLDLLVTNGKSKGPFDEDGPTHLFHNLGNDNHWIEIDLEGLATNRDAIGARVVVKAGGTAQLREQNGGVHCRSQNHQRIHFGLGANTVVDTMTVTWPSGVVQDTFGIAADQILHIAEDFHSAVDGPGAAPAAVRLDGCRPNPFNPATTLAFTLPREETVDLAVHDTAGRLVRRLAERVPFPAGRSEIRWDGRNDDGRLVSSGVYLVRLRAGGALRTGKMVLLR